MGDINAATGPLRCHWVQVTDADGRTRMEAHWAAEPLDAATAA